MPEPTGVGSALRESGVNQERDRVVALLELLCDDQAEAAISLGDGNHYAIAASSQARADALRVALHYVKTGKNPKCLGCGSIRWSVESSSFCGQCGRTFKRTG